jgi:hypothetical protein
MKPLSIKTIDFPKYPYEKNTPKKIQQQAIFRLYLHHAISEIFTIGFQLVTVKPLSIKTIDFPKYPYKKNPKNTIAGYI